MAWLSSPGAAEVARDGAMFLGGALLKGGVLLVASAVVARMLRRSSAAVRHLVWTVGVIGVLVLPPLAWLMPSWRVSLPVPGFFSDELRVSQRLIIVPETPADARVIESMLTRAAEPAGHAAIEPAAQAPFRFDVETVPSMDWSVPLMLIWLAGCAICLGALAVSWLRVRSLQTMAQPMRAGLFVDLVARATARLGLKQPPRVLVGNEHLMPMVWGLFRPVLLLPASAALWPRARLEAVILHELAHIRRRDALTQFIAELARAVYWFNPLVWLAARRLYLEREHACDDIVLNAGTRASEYAGELLDLVKSLRSTRATALAAIAMARPSQLKTRLHAVLDDARSRRGPSARSISAIVLGSLLVLLPLAALRPRAVDAAVSAVPMLDLSPGRAQAAARARIVSPRPAASPTSVSAAVSFAGPSIAADLAVQENCWSNTRRNSVSHNSNDETRVQTITWSSDRCSGSARIEGTVRMNADLTAIAAISAGGLFRIEEDNGDVERRLTVRPSGAQLTYQYRVDGRDVEFDAAGRAWLAQALLSLYRNTGFAAEERVDQLVRTQGPQAVINEVSRLRGDYVQRVYLTRLLERADLSPALVRQGMEVAARELDSDYELAQTLIAFANRHELTDETRPIFIHASTSISSDYERRRVLSTALAKGNLRGQDITALLNSAAAIRSDYEKAQVLIGLNRFDLSNAALQRAYLAATRSMSSSYEQRRVLSALLDRGTLAAGNLELALQSAVEIESDYELSQVLLLVLKNHKLDASQKELFMKALNSIGSEHEYSRVAAALLRASN